MTLLCFDGFDSQDVSLYTPSTAGVTTFSSSTRFTSGSCVSRTSGTGEVYQKRSVTASAQIFSGAAFRSSASNNYQLISFWGDSGVTQHVTIRANGTNHSIEIMRGVTAGTLLASSANDVWQAGVWAYVEASCTVADSGGTVEVRLNGNPTPVVTFTGDTKNAGTSTNIDAVSWGYVEVSPGGLDDIYVCNSSGSSPTNTFLGDVRVATLLPTGAGSSTGLTASTGSNWQTVDEVPASATDYSGSPTSGARDTYATQDLPAGATTVYGALLRTYMHKSDAGASSMKPAIKVGSTVYYGATQALPTSMGRFDDLFTASPATSSAWTVSEINGAEIGAEVV